MKFARFIKHCFPSLFSEDTWRNPSRFGLLSETAMVKKPLVIANPKGVHIHPYARLQANATILNYTGRFVVKSYAAISNNLTVVTGNHIPTVGIPQFFLGITHINDRESDIIVEEGAWIGANVTLISGSHIGRGAVVAACALVKGEVPPYSVVAGIPAKIIETVFTLDQIIEHEKILYNEEDRIPEERLRKLFDTEYAGLKVLGVNQVAESDRETYNRIVNFMKQHPYTNPKICKNSL